MNSDSEESKSLLSEEESEEDEAKKDIVGNLISFNRDGFMKVNMPVFKECEVKARPIAYQTLSGCLEDFDPCQDEEILNFVEELILVGISDEAETKVPKLLKDTKTPYEFRLNKEYKGKDIHVKNIINACRSLNDMVLTEKLGSYMTWLERCDKKYDGPLCNTEEQSSECQEFDTFIKTSESPDCQNQGFDVSMEELSLEDIDSFMPSKRFVYIESTFYIPTEETGELSTWLIGIATRIASLRNIDLKNKVYPFRSQAAVKNHLAFINLNDLKTKKERKDYLNNTFPYLPETCKHQHDEFISELAVSPKDTSLFSGFLLGYEQKLKHIMSLYGQSQIAKTLCIGSKTSLVLDPFKQPSKKRDVRKVRVAVVHKDVVIDTIPNILNNIPPSVQYKSMLIASIAERTKNILLHLDNIKRETDVYFYNQSLYKKNPLIDLPRKYEKIVLEMGRSRLRYEYLLEHYQLFVAKGILIGDEYDCAKSKKKINRFISKIKESKTNKIKCDIFATVHLRSSQVRLKEYTEFYKEDLCRPVEELSQHYIKASLVLTKTLQEGIKTRLPKLIRQTNKGINKGKVEESPDIIKIAKTNTMQRYIEKDEEILDFSSAVDREMQMLKPLAQGKSKNDIVKEVIDRLNNIITSRVISEKELSSLVQMLRVSIHIEEFEDKTSEKIEEPKKEPIRNDSDEEFSYTPTKRFTRGKKI